jgi:hypothetical protein
MPLFANNFWHTNHRVSYTPQGTDSLVGRSKFGDLIKIKEFFEQCVKRYVLPTIPYPIAAYRLLFCKLERFCHRLSSTCNRYTETLNPTLVESLSKELEKRMGKPWSPSTAEAGQAQAGGAQFVVV